MARPSETEAANTPSFGSLLREYRLAAGLSQETLAERARLSVDAIGALERGIRRIPQRATLALLVDALGVDGRKRERLEAAAVREPQARYAVARETQRRPSNLARPLSSFVGRDDDLAAMRALVTTRRLVTVVGPGGVGKTRLALETGLDVLASFEHGVWRVDLAPLAPPAVIAQEILATLGIADDGRGNVFEQLVRALAPREVLLILDNCEHVIEATARSATVLTERCPRLTVLATSREPLRVHGEHLYPLAALACPQGTERSPATELFADRASAADSAFRLNDENLAAVAEIVRRLDGLPFTIELAAAKIGAIAPAQMVRRLDEPFRLLGEGTRTALPRHRTLRGLIDWSFALLTVHERALLRRLAIFPGSWNLEGCIALGDGLGADPLPVLFSLVAKSLVVRDRLGEDDRFRLLQTVRDYAYERLAQNAEELHQVQLALVTYVEDVVARACAVPPTQRTPAWLDAIALEHDAIRAALQWALAEANAIERGAALVVGLTYFWQARRQRDGARWFELALDLADRLQPALRASVLLEYVTIRPDSRRTIASVEAAVEAYRRIPDLRGLRAALGRLGQTLINTGRFGEAERALTECLALDESARDPTVTARATVLLGAARLYGGDGQGARALFERGFALAAETDDAANVACAHYGLGETALTEGDVEVAFLHARAAIDLFSMLGDYRCIGWSRSLLAYAYLRRDALEEALTEALAAMRELRDAQYSLPFVEALLVASGALGRRGEPERAAHALAYAEGMRAVLHPFGLGQPWATLDDEARAAIAAIDVDVALTRKAGERGDVAVVFDVLEGR